MPVPTNVRAARVTALLLAFQTAKGTLVSDFTTADAIKVWREAVTLPAHREISADAWMDSSLGPGEAARYRRSEKPAGVFRVAATRENLEWLLKSNYGAFSGGTFTLATQVALTRWLTIGWVENVAGGTQQFVRIRDAWIHKLDFVARGPQDRLEILAHWAGRTSSVQALNGGGITLPASPMQPSDKAVFPVANVQVIRDPSGANVELPIDFARLTLDQRLRHVRDQAEQLYSVSKAGKLHATLEIGSRRLGDELWTLLSNNRAGTDAQVRFKATVGSSVLQVDLYNLLLQPHEIGVEGQEVHPFLAAGEATRDSSGNFVTVTLT